MKLASSILMMSVAALSTAGAEDLNMRDLRLAQAGPSRSEHQPAGACTPIGLTANGDIVFPWECRETIEKQRGPISVSLPTPSNDPPSRDQTSSPDARKGDTEAAAATLQPKVDEPARRSEALPEVSAVPAPAKPRSPLKQVSALGQSKPGRKGQHPALGSQQGSGVAKTKETVALQPAAQK
jgi:hypothetical protein